MLTGRRSTWNRDDRYSASEEKEVKDRSQEFDV